MRAGFQTLPLAVKIGITILILIALLFLLRWVAQENISVSEAEAQGKRPNYSKCASGPSLKGKLLAAHVSCPKAQRVSLNYFTHTQPGQHVGPARIGRWRCDGRWDGNDFHIKCRAPLPGPGTKHTKFVGVAG